MWSPVFSQYRCRRPILREKTRFCQWLVTRRKRNRVYSGPISNGVHPKRIWLRGNFAYNGRNGTEYLRVRDAVSTSSVLHDETRLEDGETPQDGTTIRRQDKGSDCGSSDGKLRQSNCYGSYMRRCHQHAELSARFTIVTYEFIIRKRQ